MLSGFFEAYLRGGGLFNLIFHTITVYDNFVQAQYNVIGHRVN